MNDEQRDMPEANEKETDRKQENTFYGIRQTYVNVVCNSHNHNLLLSLQAIPSVHVQRDLIILRQGGL